ncbi:hypothetical protein JCM8097_001513 [Rhodosporidiobolus ruineniae]
MSICYSAGGAPIPCTGWTVYDSYVTDPLYQRRFTIAWTATFALVFLFAAPAIVRFVWTDEWSRTYGGWGGLLGVQEEEKRGYRRVGDEGRLREVPAPPMRTSRIPAAMRKPYLGIASLLRSASLFTLPLPSFFSHLSFTRQPLNCHPRRLYLPFSLGTLFTVLLIPVFLLATLLPESQLRANPNRFGFLALACLPPIFLLSAKNGPVGWLLGRGWTAVNFLHRWIGRAVVLLVLLHFYFWAIQYSGSAQTAFLAGEKERRGIAALAFLLLIFVSSLRPFRALSYPIFFVLHYVGIVGFLVFLNKHTVYAKPWATWCVVGIYAADIAGRVLSMRVRWVEAEALEGGMVKLKMQGVHSGWRGGQHLSIRLFFSPQPLVHPEGTSRFKRWPANLAHAVRSMVRPFEAHPFSIATAPPALAADAASEDPAARDRGIALYARSCGPRTWTGDLYRNVSLASLPLPRARSGPAAPNSDPAKPQKVYLPCLLEGPYGGLSPYESTQGLLTSTESVLLVAGGSGMSFVLGVLDELVGRRLAGGKSGRVDVVWVVRQRAHVAWFAERLRTVVEAAKKQSEGRLRIVLRVYLTCDDSLTTAAPLSASASPSDTSTAPPPPHSASYPLLPTAPPETLAALLPPSTTLHYSRPALASLVRETVGRALAPCGHCFPVCRCGENAAAAGGGEGVDGEECANDEEECVGGCGGVGNGRELLVPPKEDEVEEIKEKEEDEGAEKGGCCCGPSKAASSSTTSLASDLDAITELPSAPLPSSSPPPPKSCCASSPSAYPPPSLPDSGKKSACGNCCSTTTGGPGGGCCSGAVDGPADALDADDDERDRVEGRRLKVRRGGLGVVVCGPGGMVAELRNAVAAIPLAKQVRIGGVEVHVEHYSI